MATSSDQMDRDANAKPGWLAKWRERKRRKNERLAERVGRQSHKPGDDYSVHQAEQAVRSVPTSSGGLIG